MKFSGYLDKIWHNMRRKKRRAEQQASQKVTQIFPNVTQPAGGPVAGLRGMGA